MIKFWKNIYCNYNRQGSQSYSHEQYSMLLFDSMYNLPQRTIRLEDAQLYDRITKIETTIIDKLGELRKKKFTYDCEHIITLPEHCERYSLVNDYYSKFWKLYLSVELCKHKISTYKTELAQMNSELQKIQILFNRREDARSSNFKLKPKIRRKAEEIARPHRCPVQSCDKAYGSELALKLHVKMKHSELNDQQQ